MQLFLVRVTQLSMDPTILVALIDAAPPILATAGVIVLAVAFRKPIAQRIIPRVSGLKLFGFEITLLKEDLDQVASQEASKRGIEISEDDKWSALKRAQHIAPVILGARILWVDDHPEGNLQLLKILLSLGASVDHAGTTDEALKLLRKHTYHAVISDIERGDNVKAGTELVSKMWDEHVYRWTIFYVTDLKPGLPEHAFGITNRPDHLLHLVMDALERERWATV